MVKWKNYLFFLKQKRFDNFIKSFHLLKSVLLIPNFVRGLFFSFYTATFVSTYLYSSFRYVFLLSFFCLYKTGVSNSKVFRGKSCRNSATRATECIRDIDKLNWIWWFNLRLEKIAANDLAASEYVACFKSDQKWLTWILRSRGSHRSCGPRDASLKPLLETVFHISACERHFKYANYRKLFFSSLNNFCQLSCAYPLT